MRKEERERYVKEIFEAVGVLPREGFIERVDKILDKMHTLGIEDGYTMCKECMENKDVEPDWDLLYEQALERRNGGVLS